MRIWLSLVFLASVAMSPKDRAETLDSSFEMAVSERVVIPGHIALEFREVTQDSRCPRGVQCVHAGEAIVVLDVTLGVEAPTPVTFEVPPSEGTSMRVGDYTTRGTLPRQSWASRLAADFTAGLA